MNALQKAWRIGVNQLRGHRRRTAAEPLDRLTGSVSLTELPTGCGGHVVALSGGHGLVARLATLGLTPGVVFEVAQNSGRGPVVVLVRETRLALGRGEAAHVLTVPVMARGDRYDG